MAAASGYLGGRVLRVPIALHPTRGAPTYVGKCCEQFAGIVAGGDSAAATNRLRGNWPLLLVLHMGGCDVKSQDATFAPH